MLRPNRISTNNWKTETDTVEPHYNGLGYNVHLFITYRTAQSRRFSMGKCTDITYSDITYFRLERMPITVRSVQMTPL
jgi:hypothetical protein